jgi:phospholipase C
MSAISSIDQIVIVMLENRSFDSMLGYLSLDPWAGTRPGAVNGLRTSALATGYVNPANDGSRRAPFEATTDGLLASDLPHGRWEIMSQLNYDSDARKPRMDGFVQAQYPQGATPDRPTCMGYFTPPRVPMTHFLATEYRVCDRWFSAIPADTHPNRLMSLSGYTNIDTTGSLTRQDPTIMSYFANLGRRAWVTDYAKRASFYSMLYDTAVEALVGSDRFRRWESFGADWRQPPTDPHVWIVEPAYADSPLCSWMTQGPPDDGHPPAPIALAERFLYDVYTTVISNPARWARTAMIITYDEHGGFYDHEPPLTIRTPAPQPDVYRDFPCTGPRVPAIIVSPFASRGSTFSLPMDHTSILRTLANKFSPGAAPYSPQVAARSVHSIWEALDLATPRAAIPVPAQPPAPPQVQVPVNAHSGVARAFLEAFRFATLKTGKVLLTSVAVLLLAMAPRSARADTNPCGDFASTRPGYPLSGQLRWDIAGAAAALMSDARLDTELGVGVTKIVDIAYQSLDLGVHAALGGTMTMPRAYTETVEVSGRFYPVKLRQAFGIDECGQGTKTRRWSEHTDGAGYIMLRAGYGHLHGDVARVHALLITPGVGYEWNLGKGRHSSFFAQAAWRFAVGGADASLDLDGPQLELGLRL